MNPPNRKGFTIVELFGCLCVVGLLASLLPAALLAARDETRKQQCQSNLRRLALGIHNYHNVYVQFPLGWVEPQVQTFAAPLAADSVGGYGWHIGVLPYIDQLRVYNKINFNSVLPDPPVEFLKEGLAEFRCPADRTEITNPMRGGYGTSNYSGSSGWTFVPEWGPGDASRNWAGSMILPENVNGIFWRNSSVRISRVTDGTANTLMLGEKSLTSGSGIWPGVRSNQCRGDQVTSCRYGNEINRGYEAFSSLHGNGANFLMADGRVFFINENIESLDGETEREVGLFQRLSSCNGGEPAVLKDN